MNALIGHTGFVGSNLNKQFSFNLKYNSKNISQICGKSFDKVVCAGVSGVKWYANQNAQEDFNKIKFLFEHLITCKIKELVLISTVDVYQNPYNVDEDSKADSIFPYGANRNWLEHEVLEHFSNVKIIRLPALFGEGLKKNPLFDLLHEIRLDTLSFDTQLQFYNLDNLWRDINNTSNIITNFVTPPVRISQLISNFFPQLKVFGSNVSKYDVKTKYNDSGYICSQNDVLLQLSKFIKNYG